MMGSLNQLTRELMLRASPIKRSSDFIAHLQQIDERYGPKPGRPSTPVASSRTAGRSIIARLRAPRWQRAHWPKVEWLPKYAPELNEIEPVWHDLKAHHLAHQTFADTNGLNTAIHDGVERLNRERMVDPLVKLRISA